MGKFEDLTGKKFGRLTVVESTNKHKNGYIIWKCICDCQLSKPENERKYCYVTTKCLKNGHTKSCGCLKVDFYNGCKTIKTFTNLKGKKFGRLTALEPTNKCSGTSIIWKCICDCQLNKPKKEQEYCYISAQNLKRGTTKSCGCLYKEMSLSRFKDLTGQKFGKLTVIERAKDHITPKGQHKTCWKCLCDCQIGKPENERKYSYVIGYSLTSGNTKSCGCIRKTNKK